MPFSDTPTNLYILSDDEIKEGDWCMFYDSISEVLKINGEYAKIKSYSITSKEDAEFINSCKKKKLLKKEK